MDAISPVLNEAFYLLRVEMFGYLDDAEYLAQFDEWSERDEELMRAAVPHLATVIRGLIAEHESSKSGHCKTCQTPWPCHVTESIHRLMHNPETVFVEIINHIKSID